MAGPEFFEQTGKATESDSDPLLNRGKLESFRPRGLKKQRVRGGKCKGGKAKSGRVPESRRQGPL